jgi:hypothetical protein
MVADGSCKSATMSEREGKRRGGGEGKEEEEEEVRRKMRVR